MDFPVTAELATTANYEQLHNEARGAKQSWPASFVEVAPDEWVYRVDRDDIDRAAVQSALAAHVPAPPAPDPSDDLATRLEALAAKQSPTVKDLIGALLGTSAGAVGAVAGRPTSPE
jgi:hypothetical protein